MTHFRITEAARLVGVSDDTIRRWAADGKLKSGVDEAGRQVILGASLAKHALERAPDSENTEGVTQSARNRFTGLVTAVHRDGLVAQVEMQCGPNRVVSLMTTEAADDLQLDVGSRATAVIKATMVIIEADAARTPSATRAR